MIEVEKIAHLTGHSGAIYCLAHYKDKRFFSGGFDNLIVEWNIEDVSKASAVAKLNSKAISLLYLNDKNWLLAGQSTGGVHIVDLSSQKEIHLLQAHSDMVFALCYVEESNCLYIGAADGNISVWDLASMTSVKITNLSRGKVREIQYFNNLLYVGCEDGSVVMLTLMLEEVSQIQEHVSDFSVNSILIESKRLLSGSRDGHLNHLSVENLEYKVQGKIPAHNYAIYKIVKSPDGILLATASRDKSIKIWDAKTLEFKKKIDFKLNKGHIGSVNDLIWFNDYLVSVSDDRSVIVWKVKVV